VKEIKEIFKTAILIREGFTVKKLCALMLMLMVVFIGYSSVCAQGSKTAPAPGLPPSPLPPDSDKYIIGPEDHLYIQVWKEESLSQTVLVRTDGKISLPLLDDVQAAGLTPLKLKEVLTEKFKAFVDSPVVTVIVREAKSFKVYISGYVTKPGVFALIGDTTIVQIIAMAGGFTEWANQRKVLLLRRENGREVRQTINYKKIVAGEAENILVKPGDTIIVPD
jgi:polysaccharide export outer membrane protein